jgi:uncharacterized membrane protein SpoIIM required for sporulation
LSSIFLNNLYASLFVIFTPFLVLIGYLFPKTDPGIIILYKKILTTLLVFLIMGFNSFSNLYFYQIMPIPILAAFYFHGMFEAPAFIISSIISFSSSDWIQTRWNRGKPPFSLINEFIMEYWLLFLLLFGLLLLGAFIETQITPIIVTQCFEQFLYQSTL